MIAETLSLDFVGNAAGLQDAVIASQRALQALNRDTSRFSFGIGRVMRTIVTPIASIILSAFAAKKALADFTQSGLPGVTRFNQTLGLMRISMFRLSSAVGELLAPAAERAARIVTMIADRLEPIIRYITANIPVMASLLKQFGSNLMAALQWLAPTVFKIIDSILKQFGGISWDDVWERLKTSWTAAWQAILAFITPILFRLATLLDTVVALMKQGLEWLIQAVRDLAASWGITLPASVNAFKTAVEYMLVGVLVVISTMELALKNMPMLWEVIASAAALAVTTITSNWQGVGEYIIEVLKMIVINGRSLIASIFDGSSDTIQVFGKNILTVLTAVFESLSSVFVPLANRLGVLVSSAVAKSIVDILDALPGRSGIADLLRPAANLPWDEIVRQNPLNPKAPNLGGLIPIPKPTIELPKDWVDLPQFKGFDKAAMDRLAEAMNNVRNTFGPGIADLVAEAIKNAPQLAAVLMQGMNFQGRQPGARLDRFEAIGPLLFGTAAANAKETNVGNKNPLVPIAQQQLALTREQLVQQRAAARAAERKARMANF